MNGITYRHVIPTEMKWSGGIFPSSRFYLASVISAAWVDSSTPLCYGRNDIPEGITFYPHRLYLQRSRRLIAAPTCTLGRNTNHSYGLYSLRCLAMNHRRYIAWYHLPARVISRDIPGTAHRPFPTVSLIGGFFNRHILKTGTSFVPIIVNCPLSIVNF